MLLRTLGGLELAGSPFARLKPLLLLAYLALEGPKERRHLVELFWPGTTDPLNRLAVTLTRLRQADEGVIGADALRAWTMLETDAKQLLSAVEEEDYQQAVQLYRGPFLEGVHLEDWPAELEEWVYATRDVLASQVKTAHLRLAEAEAAAGKFREAAGRAELAYRVAQTAGLEPDDLRRVHTLLLAGSHPQAFALRQEAETFGVALLDEPEAARRVLLEGSAPNNLPAGGRSFVGRDLELTELAALLARPEVRLVSIVGSGGMGKTQLALEAARRQLRTGAFKHGVYFVPLDALSSGASVPGKLAEALGVSLRSGEDPFSQLSRHIGQRAVLLVLDNLEHLLDITPRLSDLLRACPKLKLLATSRERLNLTEEWLFALGGLSYPESPQPPIPPPSAPPLLRGAVERSDNWGDSNWGDYAAATLFVQRARQTQPAFALSEENAQAVGDICRLVEGSPLGLELAATWVRLMPCEAIAAELKRDLDFLSAATRDAPDRHRSLRAAFEHSWRLLTPDERSALGRLSVFWGGFTREAAAEVAGATMPVLASLVDKSLLRADGGRYDRHPLVYQYTQEKLAEQPEEEAGAQARHAAHFSHLGERLKVEFDGPEPGKAYTRLEAELENFRAAWRWAVGHKHLGTLDACAQALGGYHFDRWRRDESVKLWLLALAVLDETNPAHRVTLAGLMAHLGFEYATRGRLDEAERLAGRGLALLRPLRDALEDTFGMFMCFIALTIVAEEKGQFDQVFAYLQEQEALGLVRFQGRHLNNLAITETRLGNYRAAQDYARRAIEHNRKDEFLGERIKSLGLLGDAYLYAGDREGVRRYYQEAMTLLRQHGPIRDHDDYMLWRLGNVALELGDLGEAEACARQLLEKPPHPDDSRGVALGLLGRVATARGDYDGAASYFRQAIERALEYFGGLAAANLGDAWDFWSVLLHVCELRLEQERHQEAAAILGFLQPRRLPDALDRALLERLLSKLRAAWPGEALEQALSESAGLELADLLRDILAETVSDEGALG